MDALHVIDQVYAAIGSPAAANRSFRLNTAQAIRASLLAKATTATLRWARVQAGLSPTGPMARRAQ
jgi:hypothetical protein